MSPYDTMQAMKAAEATMIEPNMLQKPDPLGVLRTIRPVIERMHDVSLDTEQLPPFADTLANFIAGQHESAETRYGRVALSPQKIFVEDVVNYCFWAPYGETKWFIEYPEGITVDGWEALIASFDRAQEEGIPLLDATFLSTISEADIRHIFRGGENTEIPLIDTRQVCLQEAGNVLLSRYGGRIENLLKEANYSAPVIAQTLIAEFPSFNDVASYEGKPVHFFKRAQICPYDMSFLPDCPITGTDTLTAFADYKLPQILRSRGLLVYSNSLAAKVDTYEQLPQGGQEEVEIRAATTWVCELLAQQLKQPAVTIDNGLWYLAQSLGENMKPYHRVRSPFY